MMLRPYSGEEAFLEILPFLPPQASGILEIGPGSGRFAALLAKHYPGCAIHLIDGDRSVPDAKKTGYSSGIVPWNDVTDAAVHVIREAPLAKVFGYTPDSVPKTIQCDAAERRAKKGQAIDERGIKKNAAQHLSESLALQLAEALRPRFPGIKPERLPDGRDVGTEAPIPTARGLKRIDVNFSTPHLGLALGISISMLRERSRDRSKPRGPARRALAIFGVWTFYSVIHIWAQHNPAPFAARTKFFLGIVGLG